ncbi:MAG: aldose 1-epimerase [Christensenellaceae bacterium]|jgi:aldose 1-epimerase|nr:aldose 1-epimerase [Christensenellaceae bacterium]
MFAFQAFEQKVGRNDVEICLLGPSSQFQIAPGHGFKLFSAVFKGREFIMPTRDVLAHGAGSGVPILFPFPNRTKDCNYSFGGHDCTIMVGGETVFLHGIVGGESYEYSYGADENSAWCKGILTIDSGKEYFASYPFPCTLTLTYTLSAEGLRLEYEVKNDGAEALPYGFAIHPYFNKFGSPEDVTLTVPVDEIYESEKQMPTGKLLPVEGMFDLRQPSPLSELAIDHVYHGLNSQKEAVISYKKLGMNLGLRASDEFVNMVVFTPSMISGFCLENQTNATDYLNLYAQGNENSQIQIVGPGEKRGGWIQARIF